MKFGFISKLCATGLALVTAGPLTLTQAAAPNVTLVENGRPKAVIRVSAGLMGDDVQLPTDATYTEQRAEAERRRLRESVRDLVYYLRAISGAELDVEEGLAPDNDTRLPMYVGNLAREVFGPPKLTYPYEQGWRLVIDSKGIGMIGESDLAASYALYEILHRLGCRWYMPGDLGECIPQKNTTVKLPIADDSATPSTVYRGIWAPPSFETLEGSRVRLNTSEPFTRRNRQGGLPLWATHGLARYIPDEELKANPEWRAIIGGKRHAKKLIWSKPEVAEAMVRGIIARLDKDYQPVIALAPADGIGWDESEDPAHDAGDWDPMANMMSKTDRFLVLCNRIAEGVTKTYPDVRFAVLIYVDYTRAPVREPVHPALIPYIAPILYNRMHPMKWENHPTASEQLALVKGWQNATDNLAYYWYGYNLSETWSPNPMITWWGQDLPILFGANVKYPYWFPETMSNFETSWLGLNLGMRLSWDASLNPDALVEEFISTFYGAAADPMREYWHHIDQAWVQAPEYSGAAWGFRRRFTPEVMKKARQYMNKALAMSSTPMELRRVTMADESLQQFERFMDIEEKVAAGTFHNLDQKADVWTETRKKLSAQYQENNAFYERWTYRIEWVEKPHLNVARDAARIAEQFTLLTPDPLKAWRFMPDPDNAAEAQGWLAPDHDDSAWRTTDTTLDTWSYLGFHNYFGKMVYRTSVAIPEIPEGKRVYLWLSRSTGRMQLFVNGELVSWRAPGGDTHESYGRYATPTSFDITETIRFGKKNMLAFLCERQGLDELGVGGLLGPVVLYRDN